MALLSFRGFDTPSLPAQGEQRRFSYFNIDRDISRPTGKPYTAEALAKVADGQGARNQEPTPANAVADLGLTVPRRLVKRRTVVKSGSAATLNGARPFALVSGKRDARRAVIPFDLEVARIGGI
jgi:hypothetical protein